MRPVSFVTLVLLGSIALSCKGPDGPTGPPGPDSQSLVDPSIKPRTIYSYPSSGSQGPYTDYNNRIVVRFNKIMDRTAMQYATKLTSPLGDVQLDTTTVSASNTDVFSFGPEDIRGTAFRFHWRIGNSYTLGIDTTARDVNGNQLLPAYAMTFKPEPVFRVMTTSPLNAASDIALTSHVAVTFNSQVDSSIFRSVHIAPAAQGVWSYSPAFPAPDSTVITFTPQAFLLDTTYVVSVDSSASDKYGNRIGAPFASSFTTSAFHVTTTTPLDGLANVSLSQQISVSFTTGIDTGTVRSAFSIMPAVAGDLHLSGNASSFSFVPRGHLMTNTQYTVTIAGSLRSKYGASLAQPYTFSFRTTLFQGIATIPLDGSSNVPLAEQLTLLFSDYVDTSTVRSAFSISPAVPGTFALRDSSQSFSFIPANGLTPSTNYTVTVHSSLRSKGGDTLATAFIYSFTTGMFQVASTTPADGSAGVPIYPLRPITIRFNGVIDTGSVRTAFSIIPAVPGYFVLTEGSTSFQFQPANQLALGTMYTISLSTAMASANGAHLPSQFTFTFTTVPFSVIATDPPGGSSLIALNALIAVTLNAPIDTTGLSSAVLFFPQIAGRLLEQQGSSSFTFVPSQDLTQTTQYTVTINSGLHSLSGASLTPDYSFSFTTAAFGILYTSPASGSAGVSRTSVIQVASNATLDSTTITGAFSVSPPIPGHFGVGADPSRFYFYPDGQLAANTGYAVTISTALKTKQGISLGSAYTFSFTTGN